MFDQTPGHNTITCPACQTPIPFDPVRLIRGEQFSCPGCQSVIGIDQQSRDTAQAAYKKMERELGKSKDDQ